MLWLSQGHKAFAIRKGSIMNQSDAENMVLETIKHVIFPSMTTDEILKISFSDLEMLRAAAIERAKPEPPIEEPKTPLGAFLDELPYNLVLPALLLVNGRRIYAIKNYLEERRKVEPMDVREAKDIIDVMEAYMAYNGMMPTPRRYFSAGTIADMARKFWSDDFQFRLRPRN